MFSTLAGWQTLGLLLLSNVFMTFAWYGQLAQLKITQEVVTLAVFVPFSVDYMGEPMNLDFL